MAKSSSKESTAQLFQRYVWLVDTIYRAEKITFEEINYKWTNSSLNSSKEDFPLKTFHNHKVAISDMFDIDIECNKRNGYTYSIKNPEEIEHSGVREWLLNSFAVNNLINESGQIKHRILFEKIPSGQQYLPSIIEAMRDNVALEITYQNFWHTMPDTFEMQPYCVKVFRQRWYVVGNSAKNEIRIYSLDRVQSLQSTENKFKLPSNFDGELYFSNSFGISNYGDAEFVEVLVYKEQKKDRYLKSLPLHHSQQEVSETSEHTIFSYYIQPTYDFRMELLSHGADIEVLKPQWFRDEMALIAKQNHKQYTTNKTSNNR